MTEIPESTIAAVTEALWRSGLGKLTRDEARHEAERAIEVALKEGGLVLASRYKEARRKLAQLAVASAEVAAERDAILIQLNLPH